MVREETSIAEKIIKLFPPENIVLNKKFNNRKPDVWFKNHNLIIKVDERNHENYDSHYENVIILKFFDVIPMILILIFLNFLAKQICTCQNYAKKMQKIKGIIKRLIKLLKTLKK